MSDERAEDSQGNAACLAHGDPSPGSLCRPRVSGRPYAQRGINGSGAHSHRRSGSRTSRNWRRSDEVIRADLCARLQRAFALDSCDIGVDVRDGLVILGGTVPDRGTKFRIEDMAEVCPGVRDVDNRIRVGRP
jgi:osmotically-inducible protein OsmY